MDGNSLSRQSNIKKRKSKFLYRLANINQYKYSSFKVSAVSSSSSSSSEKASLLPFPPAPNSRTFQSWVQMHSGTLFVCFCVMSASQCYFISAQRVPQRSSCEVQVCQPMKFLSICHIQNGKKREKKKTLYKCSFFLFVCFIMDLLLVISLLKNCPSTNPRRVFTESL